MNIGFWLCVALVIPFAIIGMLFAIFKEKAVLILQLTALSFAPFSI